MSYEDEQDAHLRRDDGAAGIARGVTPAQQVFIKSLTRDWQEAGALDPPAIPQVTGHRDHRLVEDNKDGPRRRYRLTELGARVKGLLP